MLFLTLIGIQEAHGQNEASPNKYQPQEFVQQRNNFEQDRLDNAYVQTENTYQAIIPRTVPANVLDQLGIISIRKNIVENKISSTIKNGEFPAHAVKAANTVEIAILINEHTSNRAIQKLIHTFNISHLQKPLKGGKLLQGRIDQNQLMTLAASPEVEYVDVINSPVVQLNHENRVLQRVKVSA